jgi:hypothetical protein
LQKNLARMAEVNWVPAIDDPIKRSEFQQQLRHATAMYGIDNIPDIARSFEITEKKHIEALEDFLRYAAWLYLAQKAEPRPAKALEESNRKFKSLQVLNSALVDELSRLSEAERGQLWAACKFSEPQEGQLSPYTIGLVLKKLGELFAIAAESTVPKSLDSGGQSSKLPLLNWAINARRFWEATLGRNFDHHQSKRNGRNSEAFRFCRMAISPLEPNIDEGSLRHAMRRSKEFLRDGLVSFR